MTRYARSFVMVLIATLASCGSSTQGVPGTTSADMNATQTVASVGQASAAADTQSVPSPATPAGNAGALNVFAAASLAGAFTELAKQFESANTAMLRLNFAGSQQLAQQIKEGAAADIFASANQRQLAVAIEAGRVGAGTQQIFARNRLVVIYPQDNPAQLTQLQDLAKPNVKLVLAAEAVPVGEYALDFLTKASELPEYSAAYKQSVLGNVVSYEENVKAVLTKVALSEADAGVVYSSDVSPEVAGQVGRIDIPDELNTLAAYPIAPISDSPNAELAGQFIEYVLSPEGQDVLAKYGFIVDDGAGQPTASSVKQP
ncbi:MAG: molybdate ABC transporter substrate-binding protein [Chloroflexi bacterium]|nr:MAG: molybdate ABC transporter substrate-binding protein [Chloroflexota bacterium]